MRTSVPILVGLFTLCIPLMANGQSCPPAGLALNFDGTNDFARISNSTSLALGTRATIEAWARPASAPVSRRVLGKGDGLDCNSVRSYEIGIGLHDGVTAKWNASFFTGPSGVCHWISMNDPQPIALNQWTHLAATVDTQAGIARLFVNGQQVAETTSLADGPPIVPEAIRVSPQPLYIGASVPALDTFFHGAIDEVRIWNIARSPAEIATSFNHHVAPGTPGLVAYWHLDEDTGQNVYDSSPSANHGSLGSSLGAGTDDPTRIFSTAPVEAVAWFSDWISHGGHRYRMTGPMTWANAEAQAISVGGHLVTVNDSAENNWLYNTFMPYSSNQIWGFFIGFHQLPGSPEPTGGWVWISGEAVTYTRWNGGEPNGTNDGPSVAHMWGPIAASFDPGIWNDFDAGVCMPGVVEAPASPCDTTGGQALQFDGVNDFARIPEATPVSINQKLTVEFWLYANSYAQPGSGEWLFSKYDGNCSPASFSITQEGSAGVQFTFSPSGSILNMGSGPVSLSQWMHVAGVLDTQAQVARSYRNGVLFAETHTLENGDPIPQTPVCQNSAPFLLGGLPPFPNNYLDGRMDEIRVWNIARTSAEIAASYNHPVDPGTPGLVGYWRFDEAAGVQTVVDSSPLQNHGTLGASSGAASDDPARITSTAPVYAPDSGPDCNGNGRPDICDLAPNCSNCIAGPVLNPAIGHVYFLLPGMSWTGSEAAAQAMGGHLADVNDAAENDWIKANFGAISHPTYGYWIGLFQPPGSAEPAGGWTWSTGAPLSYTNWAPGEPNNGGGSEDYVQVFPSGAAEGLWNDLANTGGGNIPGVVEFVPPNDCNSNGIPDECDIANCPPGDPSCDDCNYNGVPDECDLTQRAWSLESSTGPIVREFHAMAYDAGRKVTVFFGGYDGTHLRNDTWEWDGMEWTLRGVGGPSPRIAHAMAYDSARGVTVLFGGYTGAPYDDQTWEWDGAAWSLRSTSGPSVRGGHAMAYDSARGVTVLFGGNPFNNQTWEWDGNVWTMRSTSGPSPRDQHAMVFDAARGVTVLFGGGVDPTHYSDTWEWNGVSWTLRATTGPSPRDAAHGMVYDSARGETVLFGGWDGTSYYGDTWTWDGTGWTREATVGPAPRSLPGTAYDATRGAIVLFGGEVGGLVNGETWEYKPDAGDCNGNNVPDECEVAGNDCNANGVPDDCEQCGDFDNDADVDGADFSAFLQAFGAATGQPGFLACADSDADGVITLVDYQAWLACYRAFVGNPLARPPQPEDLGDMNADGHVDGLDISPFSQTLVAPGAAAFRARLVADFSGDSQATAADIEGFIAKLLGAP